MNRVMLSTRHEPQQHKYAASLRLTPLAPRYRHFWRHLAKASLVTQIWTLVPGYAMAVVGIMGASVLIALINRVAHVENISLVYLLVVIGLAFAYGRGPALVAAVLAFFAYDYFFVPPVFLLTVDQPSEWVSLAALLITALVVGQLTAAVRHRERVARESQQHTAVLYALSQDFAVGMASDVIFPFLTQRTIAIFAAHDVLACALFVPQPDGQLVIQAISQTEDVTAMRVHLDAPSHLAQATAAQQTGKLTSMLHTSSHALPGARLITFFVPLTSQCRGVGVLSVTGPVSLALLVAAVRECGEAPPDVTPAPAATLFAAFCDQMALALDRVALQAEAIQVSALREADRMKTALLGSVTHDLRTPLAAIQAAAGSLLLPETAWSDADRTEFSSLILTSAERLGRLVDNLLTLSRLEAGIVPPQKVWYLVEDIAATVLAQLDQAGRTHDHLIMLDLSDDVVQAPMDHAQIERVLMNLVENALKYAPPDSPIVIEARQHDAPARITVRVIDHGIGVPAEERAAIFDKFYRLHQSLPWAVDQPPLGTGLGLAICAGIIHEHGGQISVAPTPGGGATFMFTLPLPAASVAATPELPVAALREQVG